MSRLGRSQEVWFVFSVQSPTLARDGQSWAPASARPPRVGTGAGPVRASTVVPVGRSLQISSCRSKCSWARTDETIDAEAVFTCAACGSEWVASEAWTPIDWTGRVPATVQRERERSRGRG